ncbi:MAG: hypothetical protein ACXWZR_00550 [Mycobacterium sp.]
MGLSSADDAYTALAAKSLAVGPGYGVPQSSSEFLPFDVTITTGPPLVIPVAVAIKAFGLIDQLPGALALIVFGLQLALVGILLWRRFGPGAAAAFTAVIFALLVIGFRQMWLYGTLLGEPVAFGFVVLAVVLLATSHTRIDALGGGLCAGLAIMTKLIALFPVAAVVLAGIVVVWRERRSSGGGAQWSQRMLAFSAGTLGPGLVFEAIRLASLGLPAYVRNWSETLAQGAALGTVPATPLDIPGLILAALDRSYISVVVLVVVGVATLALLGWRGNSNRHTAAWRRLVVLGLVAAGGHWLYLLVRGAVYDRYMFVGVGLSFTALAFLATAIDRRGRLMLLGAIVAAALVFDPGTLAKPEMYPGVDVHAERLAVVSILDASPDLPYAADYWPSIQQFVYLKMPEGAWAYGRAVARFADRRFLAVMDVDFADANGDFARAVLATCRSLTPSAMRLLAFDCEAPFWDSYLPAAVFSTESPASVAAAPSDGRPRCNVEYFGSGVPTEAPLVAATSARVAIYGWAADVGRGRPPSAIVLSVVAPNGERRFVTARIQDRPDVGSYFGNSALTSVGFEAGVRFEGVPQGLYGFDVLLNVDGQVELCPTGLTVTVE